MQYSDCYRILSDVRHPDLNIDNQTLVEECRSGDKDAMSILYTRFAPRMLHVITRYVSDRSSAHDILHDGFIAAFTRIDSLRNPEHIEVWLATIMKNLSLKYLQAQTVTSILEEIPETVEEPEIDDILDFATIENLIKQLPEGYQKVFRLAVLEGKSHKEISKILGIAPNSSSSQLFHAKLRMRELIKDYRLRAGLILLLLLIVCSGLLFLSSQTDDLIEQDHRVADAMPKRHTPRPTVSKPVPSPDAASDDYKGSDENAEPEIKAESEVQAEPDSQAEPEGQAERENQCAVNRDSTEVAANAVENEKQNVYPLDRDYDIYSDHLIAARSGKATHGKGWSAGIAFDPGTLSFNSLATDDLSDFKPQLPWDTEQPPSDPDDDKEGSSTPYRMPRGPVGIGRYLASANRRHHLPLSFAVTAERRFSSWLGLESGIGYSYLHSDFEHYNLSDKKNDVSTCQWHYLEIPLKVNLYAYTSHRMNVYFGFGGRVAIPVYSYARIAPNPNCQSGRFGSKAVWSAGGSIGVALRLSKRIDLFVEPSLRYHFPQDCEIPNIWTDDEPWTLSIPIGIRFNW
ncbi:MAG: sigma-70 family RNA polymerase sigma factor [Muribaculaceae bacterium]|nr:sigma-70 family RNA polymerase sigma factor [Muribaculaceae bacterium]